MTWVTCSIRNTSLISSKYKLEAKILQLSQYLMDLQSYGANIADGVVSEEDMMSCPSSLFGTQLAYMQSSCNSAYQSAVTKTNAYIQQYQQSGAAANGTYTYNANGVSVTGDQNAIFQAIFEQELKQYSQLITKQVNEEEKKISEEKLRLETQLKAIEAEYENNKQAIDEDIKNSAIRLA